MIDLGNAWVPYIFSEKTNDKEDRSANEYRQRYIDLANDRVDADGEKLDPHERNFLELYGIPPSLAVVLRDWQLSETEIQPCLDAAKNYYYPGWWEPGPVIHFFVNKAEWAKLPKEYQEAFQAAA